MPGSILNADINFPHFTGQETTDEKLGIVTDYLYMLYEQLRYSMSNIGAENFNETGLQDILQMSAKQIDLTGYVTFNSLSTPGQTIIDGSNITTGTINAERLNLTGAISWGDLTLAAQQRVDSGKGDANPSYIHSTYISATEIRSPTIKATNFSVYPSSGDTEGSYNLYTNGHPSPMLKISHAWLTSPTVTFESPSSAEATWGFPRTYFSYFCQFMRIGLYGANAFGTTLPASGEYGQLFFLI